MKSCNRWADHVVFLHVITPESSVDDSTLTTLPLIPRSARERVHVLLRSMSHPVSLAQINTLGKVFVDRITPNSQEAGAIEIATRRQFTCKRWHEERYCRITSSKFGEIFKCKTSTT